MCHSLSIKSKHTSYDPPYSCEGIFKCVWDELQYRKYRLFCKSTFCEITMRSSTLVLKEDNSHSLQTFVQVWEYMSDFHWLILQFFVITWLPGLVQVTKLCSFFYLCSQTGNYAAFSALLQLSGPPAQSLAFVSKLSWPPGSFVCRCVGGPNFIWSVWWVEDLQMLCGWGECQGPSLFACIRRRFKCGLSTLTTVPY